MNKVEQAKKKKRIFYFDEIRALAIILVIVIHISNWFIKEEAAHSLFWSFSSSLTAFGMVGVPLFLMISGALLLNRQYGDLRAFYKKRLTRILVPFAFWAIFIVFISVSLFDYFDFVLGDIIHIIFSRGFVWFIWMMVGIYLFAPVVNSFIKEYSVKGAEIFIVIWLVTIILNTLGHYPIKNIELRYFSGYLGYFVLGWYLSNKELKLKEKSVSILSLIIFAISSAIAIYFLLIQIRFDDCYLTILPVIQAIGLYLFFKYWEDYSNLKTNSISNKVHSYVKNSKIGVAITSISICSYGIFLTHYFLIWVIQATNDSTHILAGNPFKWIPIIFVADVLLSWGLIWACSKIPYLKKVCGV